MNHEGHKESYFRLVRVTMDAEREAVIQGVTEGIKVVGLDSVARMLVGLQEERDELRRKFLKMRQKRNSKIQTLKALRKRYKDLQAKYEQLGLWSMGAEGEEKP